MRSINSALVVLDAATGRVLGTMPNDEKTMALVNDQTDRIYLVSADGMVQCFHEIGADKVTYHNPPEPPAPAEGAEKPRYLALSAPASRWYAANSTGRKTRGSRRGKTTRTGRGRGR